MHRPSVTEHANLFRLGFAACGHTYKAWLYLTSG